MPATIDAMTVHHITDELVQDKPPFRASDTWKQCQDLVSSDDNVMVAHNKAFDIDMLKKVGIEPNNVICTLKLARHFDKEPATTSCILNRSSLRQTD
jgi:exodeoxyribonuclease X